MPGFETLHKDILDSYKTTLKNIQTKMEYAATQLLRNPVGSTNEPQTESRQVLLNVSYYKEQNTIKEGTITQSVDKINEDLVADNKRLLEVTSTLEKQLMLKEEASRNLAARIIAAEDQHECLKKEVNILDKNRKVMEKTIEEAAIASVVEVQKVAKLIQELEMLKKSIMNQGYKVEKADTQVLRLNKRINLLEHNEVKLMQENATSTFKLQAKHDNLTRTKELLNQALHKIKVLKQTLQQRSNENIILVKNLN